MRFAILNNSTYVRRVPEYFSLANGVLSRVPSPIVLYHWRDPELSAPASPTGLEDELEHFLECLSQSNAPCELTVVTSGEVPAWRTDRWRRVLERTTENLTAVTLHVFDCQLARISADLVDVFRDFGLRRSSVMRGAATFVNGCNLADHPDWRSAWRAPPPKRVRGRGRLASSSTSYLPLTEGELPWDGRRVSSRPDTGELLQTPGRKREEKGTEKRAVSPLSPVRLKSHPPHVVPKNVHCCE